MFSGYTDDALVDYDEYFYDYSDDDDASDASDAGPVGSLAHDGNATLTCDDGEWDARIPVCRPTSAEGDKFTGEKLLDNAEL